jgi:hypothetical protein
MNDVNMAINSLVSDKQLAIATDNKVLLCEVLFVYVSKRCF